MFEAFVRGVLAGYGIAIPVGAIAVLIVDAGIRRGFRHGFAAGAGAATADFLYAIVAAGAGAVIVPHIAPIAPALRLLSGAVLMALAVVGLVSLRRPAEAKSSADNAPRNTATYVRFVALTIVNPLTIVYFAALILGSDATRSWGQALAGFALGAFVASLSWQTLLAALGAWAHASLPPVARALTGVLGNIIVLVFGVQLILSHAGFA